MKVLAVGGGSGGHVTPVRAVIAELAALDPELDITFVCDKHFAAQSRELMSHAVVPVTVKVISAGKLRRYYGESWLRRLLDVQTVAKNLRDIFSTVLGVGQSFWLLSRLKPDVVFAKGGYVCLPVGWAAHLLGIPLVIHDSDTKAGLTNRVLARWADTIATGAPLENYRYDAARSHFVGVPIDPAFQLFTAAQQKQAKDSLGLTDLRKPLVVVTGGGLGAAAINKAVAAIAPQLVKRGVAIYNITGRGQYETMTKTAPVLVDYTLVPFVSHDMATVLGAADVVVARGSATFFQELAALAKPTIVIPAPNLSDQLKNATVIKKQQAAVVREQADIERDPIVLATDIEDLLDTPASAQKYARNITAFAKPHAALDVANLIVAAAMRSKAYTKLRATKKVK